MTWNAIIEVLKPNPSKNNIAVRLLVFNNETYSDELEIVEIFYEHFSTVTKKYMTLYPKLPQDVVSLLTSLTSLLMNLFASLQYQRPLMKML